MTLRPANYKYQRYEDISLSAIGPVYADIELLNFDDLVLNQSGFLPPTGIRAIRRQALSNSGEMELVINQEIKELLDLPVREERTVRLADESLQRVEIVGPVEVRFENRSTIVTAIVVSDAEEILLGRIPLGGLGVFIDPESKQLVVIPDRPIKRVA